MNRSGCIQYMSYKKDAYFQKIVDNDGFCYTWATASSLQWKYKPHFRVRSLVISLVFNLAGSLVVSEPKVPGSSPAAIYVQRWALCSNRPANI